MQLMARLEAAFHATSIPRVAATTRLESIDQFRGFAVLAMVIGNFIAGIAYIPAWLKHTPDIGLTVVDLGAPWFIFAIGLTASLSAQRRVAADGWGKTIAHAFTRSMALVGIGSILSAGEIAFGLNPGGIDWGVLQAIGVANFMTVLVIGRSAKVRLAVGLLLLWAYQLLLDRYWVGIVLLSRHGGIQGSLAWTAMLILATVLADLFHSPPHGWKIHALVSTLVLVAGLGLSTWVAISKNRVTASYVLITLGVSGLLFMVFYMLTDHLRLRSSLLTACGKNPLLLYLIHQVLLGLFVLPNNPAWYAAAPLWLVVLQATALVGALGWIGVELDRRKLYFTL